MNRRAFHTSPATGLRSAGWFGQSVLLAFFLGAAVSFAASGRLVVWLIVDGAISFAFIPVIEAIAFAVLWRRRRLATASGVQLRDGLARFLSGNVPWLIWIVAFSALISMIPPHSLGPWIRLIELSALVPAAASFFIDLRFFQDELQRSHAQALKDAAIFRAVAWTPAIIYFLGIAIWAELGL